MLIDCWLEHVKTVLDRQEPKTRDLKGAVTVAFLKSYRNFYKLDPVHKNEMVVPRTGIDEASIELYQNVAPSKMLVQPIRRIIVVLRGAFDEVRLEWVATFVGFRIP